MNRWGALAMLLIVASALALRAPRLDVRPLHNDEAVNAVKLTELWQRGRYVYDPDEHHGPTLHYATLPFVWLSGASQPADLHDATLRVAPVVFGVGLILLLLLFRDGLGSSAVVWAGIFTAVSPAMVFYSRYFIHEMLLVFFTALMLGGAWRFLRTGAAHWAVLAGIGFGLMFATKETFVLAVGAMAVGALGTFWWVRRSSSLPANSSPSAITDAAVGLTGNMNWRALGLGALAAAFVWLIFFSSFFSNFNGLVDSVRTYFPWLKRAGGHSPHIHPWTFYLERLAWFHPSKGPIFTEALILLLALWGTAVTLAKRPSPLTVFIAWYTVVLTVIYCAIPYKTPWCLLGFYHGMIVMAGAGAAALLEGSRTRLPKGIVVLVLLGLTVQLAWQAWRASYVFASDRRNPYVYAQTVPDILSLVQRVEGIAGVAPTRFETVIKIVAPESDYWPLPWYLRRFAHTGWYEKLPDDPFSPIVIAASALNAQLDERSEKKWLMVGLSELRPGKFFELYVEFELWKKFVETLPRDQE